MTGQETGRGKDIILKKTPEPLEITRMGETKNLRGQGAITHGAGEYGDCNCSVRSSPWGSHTNYNFSQLEIEYWNQPMLEALSLGPAVR